MGTELENLARLKQKTKQNNKQTTPPHNSLSKCGFLFWKITIFWCIQMSSPVISPLILLQRHSCWRRTLPAPEIPSWPAPGHPAMQQRGPASASVPRHGVWVLGLLWQLGWFSPTASARYVLLLLFTFVACSPMLHMGTIRQIILMLPQGAAECVGSCAGRHGELPVKSPVLSIEFMFKHKAEGHRKWHC